MAARSLGRASRRSEWEDPKTSSCPSWIDRLPRAQYNSRTEDAGHLVVEEPVREGHEKRLFLRRHLVQKPKHVLGVPSGAVRSQKTIDAGFRLWAMARDTRSAVLKRELTFFFDALKKRANGGRIELS